MNRDIMDERDAVAPPSETRVRIEPYDVEERMRQLDRATVWGVFGVLLLGVLIFGGMLLFMLLGGTLDY